MGRDEFVYAGHSQLAAALGERYGTVYGWSRGDYRRMPLDRLRNLAHKVEVDLETLTEWLDARYARYEKISSIRDRLQESL